MFDLGEDFDIDDNFLDEVFQVEKNCSNIAASSKLPSNLERTQLNILKESSNGNSTLSFNRCDSPVVTANCDSKHYTASTTPVIVTRNLSFDTPCTSESSSRKVRPRKFPGPAGLLPERQGNKSLIATEDFLDELEREFNDEPAFKEEEVLSQDSARNLESPAWAELLRDLGPDGQSLLRRLNVASVCARAKQTRVLKVPFIALSIQNVDASTADPCLYLSDSSGEVVGAVHRGVWQKLCKDLVPSAVIVLINVGLLCAGQTTSRHYLNITENNIAALYSPTNGSDIRVTNIKPVSQPDCSKFLQIWQDLLSSPVQQPTQATPAESNHRLFTTAGLSPSCTQTQERSFNRTQNLSRSANASFNHSIESRYSQNKPSFRSNLPNRSLPVQPSFTNQNRTPVSRPRPSTPSFAPKRPRFELSTSQSTTDNFFSSESPQNSQNIVDSLLSGIDTDSLFGDF